LVGQDVESEGMVDEAAIGVKFRALAGEFNERQRRLWAASEARAAGRGGFITITSIAAPDDETAERCPRHPNLLRLA